MKNKKLIILFLVVVILSVNTEKLLVRPMEGSNIPAGVGFDLNKELNGNEEYTVSYSIYDFKKVKELNSSIQKGSAKSMMETLQDRQLRSSKPSLPASVKISVLSTDIAEYGILAPIDVAFRNAWANDRSMVVVCNGKAESILRHKIEGYASSADYIEGLAKHAVNYNFFSKEYTNLNIYIRLDSEGRNLVLPYIEIKDKELTLTGMALFKEDKLGYILSMEESKIMNMLREKKGKGILSLQESPGEFINYDTKVKRKVTCNKKKDKYEFDINLSFRGDIIENTLYKELNKENEKEFEVQMSKKIADMCNDFIKKMKNVYIIDCLELGLCGAAKYGRDTGVDWNEIVCNSDIRVNVKVKIDKIGIGQY